MAQEKQIKVRATMIGYYNHRRYREGVVFFMDEKDIKKKDGKISNPKWIEYADKKEAKPASEDDPSKVISDDEVI